MASSDSTGFHVNGWRFHQYSSSGNVLKGTSGCVLEMDDGVAATLSTGATLTINGKVTLGTSGQMIDPAQVISTTGGTILNHGVTVITCTSSEMSFDLAAPVQGSRKSIIFGGEVSSSSLVLIVSSSGRASIGTGAAGGTSGDRLISSSSNEHRVATALGAPVRIDLEATGTGHWKLVSPRGRASDTTGVGAVAMFTLSTN